MIVSGSRSCHIVIWFRVAVKPEYTGLIRDSKGKRLVVAKEDFHTS
jgi:hypothetical protein